MSINNNILLLNNIENIKKKIDNLEIKIDLIMDNLKILNNNNTNSYNQLNEIKYISNKMSNHIDFIDDIYNYVKQPLFFIINKLNKLNINYKKGDIKYILKNDIYYDVD
jgi:hypothetical protein